MSNPFSEKDRVESGLKPAVGGVEARGQGASGGERRDFFGEAMREMLGPITGIIERKINPLLSALEQIPEQAERLANLNFGVLDQPQARAVSLPQKAVRRPARYLRPPGAMAPGEFETVCTRSGQCVEACPAHAIVLDANGLVAEGLPYIVAEEQPCVVCESLACMKSCPTGALKLVDRWRMGMGTAVVDHRQCLRDRGEGCRLCVEVCPIDGKGGGGEGEKGVLAAIFISEESGRIRVRRDVCVGCGLCESRCPTEPRAITVIPFTPPVDPIVA